MIRGDGKLRVGLLTAFLVLASCSKKTASAVHEDLPDTASAEPAPGVTRQELIPDAQAAPTAIMTPAEKYPTPWLRELPSGSRTSHMWNPVRRVKRECVENETTRCFLKSKDEATKRGKHPVEGIWPLPR